MSLGITLDKNGTQLEHMKDGVRHCKIVDLGELIAVLQSHAVHDFGMLPANTRHIATSGNSVTIAVEVPPGKRDLTVAPTKRGERMETIKGIPLPAALFVFNFIKREGRFMMNTSYLFAMEKDRLLFSNDNLYIYPLPNVYPKDNRICWGDNEQGEGIKTLAAVEGLVKTYFNAPFNLDLFETTKFNKTFPWNKIRDTDGYYSVKNYFNYLVENGFDKTWLKSAGAKHNDFNTAIRNIGR